MTETAGLLDHENPWPGLDSFNESAHGFFFGRDQEVTALVRSVLDTPVTVLYGRSGLGKTSLLRAGISPLLREEKHLPIHVRFDVRQDSLAIIDQLSESAFSAIATIPDAPARSAGESLWEYMHRVDFELWDPQNFPLIPVLIMDQFEEIFTLGTRIPEAIDSFRNALGDLIENRIPPSLSKDADIDESVAAQFNLRTRNYKILISLREDFLPELDGWCHLIPTLRRSRIRLLPMHGDAALDAVSKPASQLMTTALARQIVGIIAGEDLKQVNWTAAADQSDPRDDATERLVVEPALLSLFCRELNEERKRRGSSCFNDDLVEGAKRDILQNYYASCVDSLSPNVARFIESQLITEKGYRNSYTRDDAVASHITEDELGQLIKSRLLRIEERYGTQQVELTHDVLTGVVLERRDRRRTEDEKAALAARADEERRAIAEAANRRAELDSKLRHELERRLESEARDSRRLRLLAIALVLAVATAISLAIAADQSTREAAAARDTAMSQQQLAEDRLSFIARNNAIRQAVVGGNASQIAKFISDSHSTVQFTAKSEDLHYRAASDNRKEIYRVTLAPAMASLPSDTQSITYRLERTTFPNVVFTSDRAHGFLVYYDGYGCLANVPVEIEFSGDDHQAEVSHFNVCEELAGQPPRPYAN